MSLPLSKYHIYGEHVGIPLDYRQYWAGRPGYMWGYGRDDPPFSTPGIVEWQWCQGHLLPLLVLQHSWNDTESTMIKNKPTEVDTINKQSVKY